MFNLIITVISIALVAALALASIYYGGSALSQGSAKAAASTLVNQGQQLNGAAALYSQNNGGTAVSSLSSLTSGKYLSSIPAVPADAVGSTTAAWAINSTAGNFTVGSVNKAVCQQVQKIATGSTTVGTTASTKQTFGCYNSGSTATPAYTFFYQR